MNGSRIRETIRNDIASALKEFERGESLRAFGRLCQSIESIIQELESVERNIDSIRAARARRSEFGEP
jgi:exonuclease VII small subunit